MSVREEAKEAAEMEDRGRHLDSELSGSVGFLV